MDEAKKARIKKEQAEKKRREAEMQKRLEKVDKGAYGEMFRRRHRDIDEMTE